MLQRYSFIVLFLSLLSTLNWWSAQIGASLPGIAEAALSQPPIESARRLDLVEALDRLVAYEHYYHSVYGHFTKLIPRLGYSLPSSLLEIYDIRVSQASRDRLLVTAVSEVEGRTDDVVSIDQDYRLHSSFPMPLPRQEHLKALALKQLRALRDAPAGIRVAEQGVFRGYFRFDLKQDAQNRKLAIAVGVRPPVVGMQLELGTDSSDAPGPEGELAADEVAHTGQVAVTNVMSTMEEAYLAQKIFHGEVGRYARNWSELSRIAAFRFEEKDHYGSGKQVPFGDVSDVPEIDASNGRMEVESNNQETAREPSSADQPLEIEAL